MTDNINKEYRIYDWIFVFKAVMVICLNADCNSRRNGSPGKAREGFQHTEGIKPMRHVIVTLATEIRYFHQIIQNYGSNDHR